MTCHAHQCGLTALGLLPGVGCGYVWTHETRVDWRLADHYCPRCGVGPFTYHVPTGVLLALGVAMAKGAIG